MRDSHGNGDCKLPTALPTSAIPRTPQKRLLLSPRWICNIPSANQQNLQPQHLLMAPNSTPYRLSDGPTAPHLSSPFLMCLGCRALIITTPTIAKNMGSTPCSPGLGQTVPGCLAHLALIDRTFRLAARLA